MAGLLVGKNVFLDQPSEKRVPSLGGVFFLGGGGEVVVVVVVVVVVSFFLGGWM